MINQLDFHGNSHIFTFLAFSPKFGKLSAKWLFGKVVFGKVSCIGME